MEEFELGDGLTAAATADMEAVAEVRMGETRGGQTIINEEEMVEHNGVMGTQSSDQDFRVRPSGDELSDQTFFDIVLTTIHTYLYRLFFPFEYIAGEERRRFLSDEEIDQLAIFQGDSVEAYVEQMERTSGKVPNPEKSSQIKAFLEDEDYVEWERRCRQLMSPNVLHSHFIKEIESYRGKLRAFLGSWSSFKDHCSASIYLLDDQLTAHRIPVVNQSDAIRSKIGVSTGIHAWDMKILGPLGTHCSIGIGLRNAPLMSNAGYISMIGDDDYSWGWDLVWGNLSHGGKVSGNFPAKHVYEYTPGDTIRLILDCDSGQLSYAVNEMGFGVAFEDLPKGQKFYPMVGLVYGNIEVSLIYLGPPPLLRNDISNVFGASV